MARKKLLDRLTKPVAAMDKERLREFCAGVAGTQPIEGLTPRQPAVVVGEIRNVRIVPRRDGSSWLEATVNDGTGSLVAMWTGRTRIAGVKPGQKIVVRGRGAPTGPGGRLMITNPLYELL